ncbi:MAG: LacI family DNA-binding transcriptional regulator [Carnobacterium maltaromaticum]|uniref:LacI family DNA-binding transcriptional regulator n=1 Tax=Carnobacterium maltaromaticum TaxID=2751 RepID=A0AAW9JNY0_CARML|nr:LacI family DNA-binding transcriptional regulator [Carnobacterium maltaromaticum]MDZ5757298.1 LacI family DNA-binding transcriptional regulator [Carnobacterium maltaromaticum]CAD5896392.1 conserved hypothetical protein [Carnobacterium maltaromaticum]
MTNIKDIARLANVSVSTVSRVMNQHPHVSDSVRKDVLKIAEKMNYVANENAVKLSRGKSGMIGVIIPYNNNSCYDELIQAILKETKERGYQVLLLPTYFEKKAEEYYCSLLSKKVVDGMIITSKISDDAFIEKLAKNGEIISTEKLKTNEVTAIFPDRKKAYSDVFSYLKNQNYSSIVFTINREVEESTSSREKVLSYTEIFGEARKNQQYFSQLNSYQGGYELAQKLFKQQLVPDAIFSNGDEVAAGIIGGAAELGYHYKNDFEIIGEGNLSYSKLLNFSSIDFHQGEIGKAAVQQLLSESKPMHQIKLATFINRRI